MGELGAIWPDPRPDVWNVRLLGHFEVTRGGKVMPKLRSRSANSLLAFLSLKASKEFSRSDLAVMFWPDSDGDRQQQNLRRALSDIRHALEEEFEEGTILVGRREIAAINSAHLVTDVQVFQKIVQDSTRATNIAEKEALIRRAIELYDGAIAQQFADYCFTPIRAELEEIYVQVVIEYCNALGSARSSEAIATCHHAIQRVPLREDIYIALIKSYIASGSTTEAIRQYETMEQMLDDNFGESPSAAAIAVLESIPKSSATRARVPAENLTPDTIRIVIVGGHENQDAANQLLSALAKRGFPSQSDHKNSTARLRTNSLAKVMREAETVIALISSANIESEVLFAHCEFTLESYFEQFRPLLVPVFLDQSHENVTLITELLRQCGSIKSRESLDLEEVADQIVAVMINPNKSVSSKAVPELELSGGGISLQSQFYIERTADKEMRDCLTRGEGVLLVKGPRQIGKTSLTARGLAWAKDNGYATALCDFQTVSTSQLSSEQGLYRALAYRFAKDLGVDFDWQGKWNDWLGPNDNLEDAVEQILLQTDKPVLWAMDEVDRLFGQSYTNDFFGLLRGWYNRRSLEPDGPWRRLVLLITYATEAHLFITDLNQSPFNVGVRLELNDFTVEQVAELNKRYGMPISSPEELEALWELTGGHPFLTRKAFDWIVTERKSVHDLEDVVLQDDGPFGDHFRRLAVVIGKDSTLKEAVVAVARGESIPQAAHLHRLRTGGVLALRDSGRFRVPAYRDYLRNLV